jgi:sorting nexin-8
VRKLGKQLIFDFDNASNTIFSLGECFAALYNATSNFNKSATIGKNEQLEDIYLTLNNMMVSWGEQMLGQIKIVQKNIGYFFKYAYYENESFKEAVGNRSRLGLDYVKRKKEMLVRKEKSFLQADSSKWDLNHAKIKELGVSDITKNKQLAMDLMFHKVRKIPHE